MAFAINDEKRGLALARHCGHGADPGALGHPSRSADAASHSIRERHREGGPHHASRSEPDGRQEHGRDDGRRAGRLRLRRRRAARHLLHERREAAIALQGRAGAVEPAVSKSRRHDVRGRHRARRRGGRGLLDRRRRRRLRQRRPHRSVRRRHQRQSAVSQPRRRHVRRCDGGERDQELHMVGRGRAGSTTTTTAASTCSSSITSTGRHNATNSAAIRAAACASTATPSTTPGCRTRCIATAATAPSRTSPSDRASRSTSAKA